jgi:hypothetical protein
MALFDKNPNYNPNDPKSNRYLSIGGVAPATLNTPANKYSASSLSLLKLQKPLFNIPFIPASNRELPAQPLNLSVPQGTPLLKTTPGIMDSAQNALNKGVTIPGLAPTPAPTPTPTPAPEVTPAPNITPAPAPTAGKSFYREGGSLFDSATGAKILNQEQITAGGYNKEVAKPSTLLPEDTGGLTGAPEKASDLEIQNILKLAGEAGIGANEAMQMVDNYNALTATEREDIKKNLGISDVVASAFSVPTQTTTDYFNKGYAASDAPRIKQEISKFDEQIAQRNKDLATETESIQNNPWLSQASRTGRLGILSDKATADITNLTNQRLQLVNQYDKEITNIENDVTRYKDQLETDRTINANKLNYLLNEAEKQYTTATAAKKSETLKFLPDYLKTTATKQNEKTAYELEKARLENLKLQQETGTTGETTNVEGSYTNISQGIVGGYDIGSYATDPNHEKKVQSILTGIGKFNSIPEIDSYIKRKYPNSPITGQMIANAAGKYGVSWEMMTAMMEQDSSMGTAGLGAKNNNPGNIGQFDSLGKQGVKGYNTLQEGVDAVASWLSRHKSTATPTSALGYTNDQLATAKSIMTPGSTLTVDKIKQADRPGVEAALSKLRSDALATGDIYGIMKASAGGSKMDSTAVNIIAKYGTSVAQLVDLKKEIDSLKAKGGTGSFKGRITDKKFWDADNATIRAKLQGAIPTIARGVFGEVGVLTDQDIENYKQTIPNVKTPTEAVDRIYQGLLATINSRILSTYESYANAGYDVSGFAETYRNLKQSISANSVAGLKVKNPLTGEIKSGAGLSAQDIAEAKRQGYEIIE